MVAWPFDWLLLYVPQVISRFKEVATAGLLAVRAVKITPWPGWIWYRQREEVNCWTTHVNTNEAKLLVCLFDIQDEGSRFGSNSKEGWVGSSATRWRFLTFHTFSNSSYISGHLSLTWYTNNFSLMSWSQLAPLYRRISVCPQDAPSHLWM